MYRVFIWNLGKLTVYYRGLYSFIWATTWGKNLIFIGHFSRFRYNITIPDIFGSNWPFLTGSPKEKNKQIHCSSVQSSDQKFLFAELLKLFHLMDLYLTCLIMVCWIPTHYKGPISGNTLKNHILQNVRCWVLIISWN